MPIRLKEETCPGKPVSRFPLAHTFSIIARDSRSGDLGVAVQSHWFSVGSIVPWAEPGVGVVATQAMVNVSYGPVGMEELRREKLAPEVMKGLLEKDDAREVRQVALMDSKGNVAVHTGSHCIAEAGHFAGEGFSTQANMMANDTVWKAMADAYVNARGDLASVFWSPHGSRHRPPAAISARAATLPHSGVCAEPPPTSPGGMCSTTCGWRIIPTDRRASPPGYHSTRLPPHESGGRVSQHRKD